MFTGTYHDVKGVLLLTVEVPIALGTGLNQSFFLLSGKVIINISSQIRHALF